MKNKIHLFVVLYFIVVLFSSMSLMNIQAVAEENGGAIGTKGEFILQDESTTETTATSSNSTSESLTTTSTSKPVKPIGRFPSTGELVKSSFAIAGVLICLVVALIFVKKKRGEKQHEEK